MDKSESCDGSHTSGVSTQQVTALTTPEYHAGRRANHVSYGSKLTEDGRHPRLAQHGEPHALGGPPADRQHRRQPLVEEVGEAPAADRLEAGHRVVGDRDGSSVGARPEVEVGAEAVGRLGLGRAVGLVERHHRGAGLAQRLGHGPGDDAEAAELADHDPAPGQGAGRPAQLLGLAHGGDDGPVDPVAEAVEGVDRLVAADAVGGQTDVALEVVERPGGQGAEDPVDPAGVEAEAAEAPLQLGDVVAAEVGGAVVEEAVAEVPAGLDQGGPGLLVAEAVDPEAPGALEGADGRLGGGAVTPDLGAAGVKPAAPRRR